MSPTPFPDAVPVIRMRAAKPRAAVFRTRHVPGPTMAGPANFPPGRTGTAAVPGGRAVPRLPMRGSGSTVPAAFRPRRARFPVRGRDAGAPA